MGRAHDDGVQSVQSYPPFGAQDGNTVQNVLLQRCRPFAPQNHRREGVCSYQGRRQARPHFGGTLQPEREQLIPYLKPQDASSCRKQERFLHRNITALASRLPGGFRCLQGLEAPTFDFSDSSLDDNFSSRKDMLQDAKDYTSAIDFDFYNPPLIPAPGGSSPRGATPQESPSSATYLLAPAPETAPAPGPAPAAP